MAVGSKTNIAVSVVLMLAMVGFIGGATILALDEFDAQVDDGDPNVTTAAEATVGNSTSGINELAGMMPTVGLMGGIVVLFVILGVAFKYIQGWA